MASSTRQIFQATKVEARKATRTSGAGRQTTTIRTRRTEAQAKRVEMQQQAVISPSAGRPALAGRGGTVQPLGGDAVMPRATQLRAGVPVGGVVQYNQGVMAGPSLAPASPVTGPAPSGISQLDFLLPADTVEDGEYLLCLYQCERVQLVEVFHSPGITVTTTPEKDAIINIGDSIILTLSDALPFEGDFNATLKFRAV